MAEFQPLFRRYRCEPAIPAADSGGTPVFATIPVTIAHSAVYVGLHNEIDAYYDGNTGTPNVAIAGSSTTLDYVYGIAADAYGALYAENAISGSVTEFAPGANGNVAPNSTIAGSSTGLSGPEGVAVDPNGVIYVANHWDSNVLEYSPGANGNVAPVATIPLGAMPLAG